MTCGAAGRSYYPSSTTRIQSPTQGTTIVGRALIVEEFSILGAIMESKGIFPEVLYHRTFLEQNMTSYQRRIATGEFGLIWLTMPQNNRRAVLRILMKKLMMFYSTLLTEARNAETLAVLTGFRNTNWMDEHLVSLCQDGKVECHKHALCRLGLSLQRLSKPNYLLHTSR